MSRDLIFDVAYYDCAKPDGMYIHPYDCSRFIQCLHGRANDFPCPDCDQNNAEGCAGSQYLYFNADDKTCGWPAETPCVTEESAKLECYEDF